MLDSSQLVLPESGIIHDQRTWYAIDLSLCNACTLKVERNFNALQISTALSVDGDDANQVEAGTISHRSSFTDSWKLFLK